MHTIEQLLKELADEQQKRQTVEHMLNGKDVLPSADQLYAMNQSLLETVKLLRNEISELTGLPNANPNPVLKFSNHGHILIYANPAGMAFLHELEHPHHTTQFAEWKKMIAVTAHNHQSYEERYELAMNDKTYLVNVIKSEGTASINVYINEISYIKQIEWELLQGKLRYKHLVESANDLVYNTDEQGNFTYVNPTTLRVLGYRYDEIMKMSVLKMIHPHYRYRVLRHYIQHKNSEHPSTSYYEFPLLTKTGKTIWVGQNVHLNFSNGKVNGFSVIARDITDLIQSQNELKVSNQRLSSLLSNLYTGILFGDEGQKISLVNQEFCDMFDIEHHPDTLIGLDFNETNGLMRPMLTEADMEIEAMDRSVANKEIILGEEIYLNNGKILERDSIPVFMDDCYIGHLWQYKDVTQQRQAALLIEKNEQKYRQIIQNMNLGLLEVSNEGLITNTNPNFCKMIGYSPEELMGQSAVQLLVESPMQNKFDPVWKLRQEGLSSAYEAELIRKDGSRVWVLISGAPVLDKDGKTIGSIGIHLDITDRKLQENTMHEAYERAESSSKAKEIFLANMSHEIRTPMNAIFGMTQLLEKASLKDEEWRYLEAIKSSSESLLVIINDILDFSKIDSGKLEIEHVPFTLQEVLHNVMLPFELRANEKQLMISQHIDPGVSPYFWGDPNRLSQVLTNLLGNALKFTDEGYIGLECLLEQEDPEQQVLKFRIIDTGIGIDRDKLEAIFDSFVQENSSITRRFGGSGLGLSISKQLIKLFGGKLEVISSKGKGSVFYFSIPLKKATVQDVETVSGAEIDLSLLKGIDVLLAEDNKINQYLATTMLEQMGMNVYQADDGNEAVQMLERRKFDVVLMDVQMPEIDGLEATRIIRRDLKDQTPIIALTANAIKGDREHCLEAGMDDYMSKPFKKEELARKIFQLVMPAHNGDFATLDKKNHLMDTNKQSPSPAEYSLDKLKEQASDNMDFIKSMIELFIQISHESIGKLQKALAQNDFATLKSVAHSIKPSIDLLDIHALKKVVRDVEGYLPESGNQAELTQNVSLLVSTLEGVISKMKEEKFEE